MLRPSDVGGAHRAVSNCCSRACDESCRGRELVSERDCLFDIFVDNRCGGPGSRVCRLCCSRCMCAYVLLVLRARNGGQELSSQSCNFISNRKLAPFSISASKSQSRASLQAKSLLCFLFRNSLGETALVVSDPPPFSQLLLVGHFYKLDNSILFAKKCTYNIGIARRQEFDNSV